MPDLRDACLDLLIGGRCVGCETPGRVLCPACWADLPSVGVPSWPTPSPPGLATPYAAGDYDGLLRCLVLGHKEHRMLGLCEALATVLASVVLGALNDVETSGAGAWRSVLLVPVPSRAANVRARGHDPTASMTAAAARRLRDVGVDAGTARLLRSRRGVLDQSGLDASARGANLAGSMACDPAAVRRLARRCSAVHVVVCDDVLTTASTAREAQRALAAIGLDTLAIATVAATRRRGSGRTRESLVLPAPDFR